MPNTLILDTASSGGTFDMKNSDPIAWTPHHMIRLASLLVGEDGQTLNETCWLIRLPTGDHVDHGAARFHGITDDMLGERGRSVLDVLADFGVDLSNAATIVCHSWNYHRRVMEKSYAVNGYAAKRAWPPVYDVMVRGAAYVAIERKAPSGGFSFPRFEQLHEKITGRPWEISKDPVHDGIMRVRLMKQAHQILTRESD